MSRQVAELEPGPGQDFTIVVTLKNSTNATSSQHVQSACSPTLSTTNSHAESDLGHPAFSSSFDNDSVPCLVSTRLTTASGFAEMIGQGRGPTGSVVVSHSTSGHEFTLPVDGIGHPLLSSSRRSKAKSSVGSVDSDVRSDRSFICSSASTIVEGARGSQGEISFASLESTLPLDYTTDEAALSKSVVFGLLFGERLNTFREGGWPTDKKSRCSARRLALNGFIFEGVGEVSCYVCLTRISELKPESDPWTEHKKAAPNCLFVAFGKPTTAINGHTVGQMIELANERAVNYRKRQFDDAMDQMESSLSALKKMDIILNRQEAEAQAAKQKKQSKEGQGKEL